MIQLFLIALGLSMDACAVSVGKGLQMKQVDKKYMLTISAFFGGFQAIMPIIGYFMGAQFTQFLTSFSSYIACGLLAFIGVSMILESRKPAEEDKLERNIKEILVLSVATSVDALAVGISFALIGADIWMGALIIGVVTFGMCCMGVYIGNRFGIRYKQRAEMLGGLILIGMGIKMLFN